MDSLGEWKDGKNQEQILEELMDGDTIAWDAQSGADAAFEKDLKSSALALLTFTWGCKSALKDTNLEFGGTVRAGNSHFRVVGTETTETLGIGKTT